MKMYAIIYWGEEKDVLRYVTTVLGNIKWFDTLIQAEEYADDFEQTFAVSTRIVSLEGVKDEC